MYELTPDNVLAVVSNNYTADFRTTTSLAADFGTTPERMRTILEGLWRERKLRRPVGWELHLWPNDEADWWRYPSRGLTWREKWRIACAVVGRQVLSNGFPPPEKEQQDGTT